MLNIILFVCIPLGLIVMALAAELILSSGRADNLLNRESDELLKWRITD